MNKLFCAAGAVLIGAASMPTANAQTSPRQIAAPADGVGVSPFGAAPAIGEADLRKVTGREDTGAMVATATERNTVSNNSVIGTSTTGSVRIDGNAFQNLQGLAVINANSGNNVAINSAMNVTVNLAPR